MPLTEKISRHGVTYLSRKKMEVATILTITSLAIELLNQFGAYTTMKVAGAIVGD